MRVVTAWGSIVHCLPLSLARPGPCALHWGRDRPGQGLTLKLGRSEPRLRGQWQWGQQTGTLTPVATPAVTSGTLVRRVTTPVTQRVTHRVTSSDITQRRPSSSTDQGRCHHAVWSPGYCLVILSCSVVKQLHSSLTLISVSDITGAERCMQC